MVTRLSPALMVRATGQEVPVAYLNLEVVTTTLYLVGASALIAAMARGWSLALIPLAILLGWLVPGHGLYPGQAAPAAR